MSKNYDIVLLDADETVYDFKLAERTAVSKTLAHFGVDPTDEEYKTLARKAKEASATGTLGSVKKLYEADMEAIFRMAGNKK